MQELPAPDHQIRTNADGSGPSGDPRGPEGPNRRQVLAAGAFGVTAFVLPTSLAAASPGLGAAGGLAARTSVTAEPIGYVSAGSTGGIRVAWSPVTGAGSYEVRWSLASVNGPYTDGTITTSGTTVDLTGLAGTDTTHHVVVTAISGASRSLASEPARSSRVIATGGTVTTFVGNGTTGTTDVRYVVHSFTTVGTSTFTLNRPIDAEHLIVAGGGGGGSRHGGGGGGGGAGGLLTNVGSAQARAAQAWTVVVGAGGAGVVEQLGNVATFATPSPGGPSSAFGVEAIGGGRGGSVGHGAGGAGGSGGGAQYAEVSSGSGTSGQGNAGGAGRSAGYAGGGGGGAGAPGSTAVSNVGGRGGDGASSSITGSPVTYAGGGGGASSTAGAGGSGGGGGGSSNGAGSNGSANTGGGGGSGNMNESVNPNVNFKGGDGGSGIVIVRYPLPA